MFQADGEPEVCACIGELIQNWRTDSVKSVVELVFDILRGV